jgi:lipopolysaccharide transport system ATP-binding protein
MIWALRDVSFEVRPGEILGVIGPNGSGKTTLLKILARVTRPTAGFAVIDGRVGSLLDVGTGFHPELTGRENVYLSGAILGMPRAEIDRKFDAIVDFAGHEAFLDTPVKRYSTGMYMRLAFSVAAHLDPDILITDEVLAVGDAAFQKKSLGIMEGVAREGRTVVFVSHNMVAVEGLCHSVLRLDAGRVVDIGRPRAVISQYLQQLSSSRREQEWLDPSTAPGADGVRMRRAAVGPIAANAADQITARSAIRLEFEYWNLTAGRTLDLGVRLTNDRGIVVFETSPAIDPGWIRQPMPAGLFRSTCTIPGDFLMAGQYRVGASIVVDESQIPYDDDGVLTFDVQESPELRGGWFGDTIGVVRPVLHWATERISEDGTSPAP